MGARLFVSYRREDSQHVAGRLFDRLEARYGIDSVFMDVDSIDPGLDFADVITAELDRCHVLLALIGRQWSDTVDERGERRLDNPDDFVRLEISAALRRAIPVIPVLIDGALLPRRESLPDDLAPLVRRHSLRLSHPTFNGDLSILLEGLDRLFKRIQTDPELPGDADDRTERPDAGPETAGSVIDWKGDPASQLFGTLSINAVRNKRFRMARKSGYEVLEVDEFVDEVEQAFAVLSGHLWGGPAAG